MIDKPHIPQHVTHNDGRRGNVTGLQNERCVGALAGAGGSIEPAGETGGEREDPTP